MSFITHVAVCDVCATCSTRPCEESHALNREQASGVFNISFNSSIITRYCVERRVPLAGDWADYVSCNGPHANDYECLCDNWIDRCIGRLDISPCRLSNPSWLDTGDGFLLPESNCSTASLERSAREVGRLPIYSPMPIIGTTWPSDTHGDWNCSRTLPAAEDSTFLGSWYSTPLAAACPPGTSVGSAVGGCSWARHAAQHFVEGGDLLRLGFNVSVDQSKPLPVEQIEQNQAVILLALEQHEGRCCGC